MEALTRGIDNDTRGWIMCIVSGIACIFGASIVCVDSLVRLLPGMHDFRIEESNIFLACSLSLSFGVMLFSALYSMLPEAKGYLQDADWSEKSAGLLMMACFIAGFVGIQVVSRLLHQFMPTHVVDCDHTHDDKPTTVDDAHNHDDHGRQRSKASTVRRRQSQRRSSRPRSAKNGEPPLNGHRHGLASESTPLLQSEANGALGAYDHRATDGGEDFSERTPNSLRVARSRATTGGRSSNARRPSMFQVQKRVMSFVKDTKCNCDELGRCYGYSDPCGQECFKHLSGRSAYDPRGPQLQRTTTGPFYPNAGSVFHGGSDHSRDDSEPPASPRFRPSRSISRDPLRPMLEEEDEEDDLTQAYGSNSNESCASQYDGDVEAQHHHHVPTNAFLSIGLQTSIAIALHKFPEGFITYATNHANPALGFNVFMALFVHNISEGFAMCLPLYMALGSRWRAMAWSALLGGLSQPAGAAVAVLWFKLADRTNITPNEVAYACLFAVTAGIMVSVALQLFVESLSLNHNRNLCILFGFLGMALLGLSNALFGGH